MTSNPRRYRTEDASRWPEYVFEREIPGAGRLSTEELQGISRKSCKVLSGMGGDVRWVQSYVTGLKYCMVFTSSTTVTADQMQELGMLIGGDRT